MPRPKKEAPNRSDGRFEVKITIGHSMDGKIIRKSFYSDISKEDAKRQAEEYKINAKASEMAGMVFINKNVTFAEWALFWLENYKESNVRYKTYRDTYYRPTTLHIIPYFGNADIRDIRPVDIKNFFNIMQEKYSESYLHKFRICLNSAFEAAIDNSLCSKNPVRNIKYTAQIIPEERNIFTEEQYDTTLKFCDEHEYGIYTRILLELGVRPCELCGLKYTDIDKRNSTIHVQRDVVTGKSGIYIDASKTRTSDRILPVSSVLFSRLAESPLFETDQFILQTQRGNILDCSGYTHMRHAVFFKALMEAHPEIPYLTPHELRHTCGTLKYRQTHDIYAVSKYLGHADVSITAKLYVHSDAESLRKGLQIV